MYVNVHVTVHDFEKLMEVFRSALVKEYHKETGILFENNVLKMKLHFDKTPPQETIYSFCDCGNVTYLEYNYSDSEDHDRSNQLESGKAGNVPESKPDEVEAPAIKKTKKQATSQIPEFEEIAKNSNSKLEFLEGLVSFLEIPKDLENAFLQIVRICPELKKVTWDNLLVALEENGVAFNSYHRRILCDCVTKKLNIRFISALTCINSIIVEHGKTALGANNTSEEAEKVGDKKAANGEEVPLEKVTADSKNTSGEEAQPEEHPVNDKQTLFKCMPQFVESPHAEHVSAIEQLIKSIAPDKEAAEKLAIATVILASKCLPKAPNDNEVAELSNFAFRAMKTLGNENHSYFKPETVVEDKVAQNTIRMQILKWSTITNNLAKYYDPNFSGKITAAEFLANLKELLDI